MCSSHLAVAIVVSLAAVAASSGEEACRAQSQSYSRCRLLAANSVLIPPEAIRTDEWINYMEYRFPDPPLDADHQGRVGLWGVVQMNPSEAGSSAFPLIALRTAPYQSQREQPVDLVIVLDRSGSMGDSNKMEFAQKGIQKLVTGLTAEDRVGLLGFDNEVYIERKLSAWKPGDDLGAELKRLLPRGSTDMNQGLLEGMKMLRSAPSLPAAPGQPARAQRLLVITDAQTNTGECDTERVVKSLEEIGRASCRERVY
jgi:Ca-activated chloride channel homolog